MGRYKKRGEARGRDTGWVDLHTHTTASDGELSPSALVEKAARIGLRAVAITDHDTVDGIPEAEARGKEAGLEVIPGVEISVEAGSKRTFHLLGYFVDHESQELRSTLRDLQLARSRRNDKMLRRLADLGMPLDPAILAECQGGGLLGRPHMAQAMVRHGHVASVEEAFAKFLGKGRPAYVEKFRLGPVQAVSAVKRAGGVPVLAHPCTLNFETSSELEAFVGWLVQEAGVVGIEVLYPDHTPADEALCRALARKYGLVMTGGTDFHGVTKPRVALGWGRGTLRVPYGWARALRQRALSVTGQGVCS